ncbi:MAG: hypothetical protein AAF447_06910 [Myxococcota bacterium]
MDETTWPEPTLERDEPARQGLAAHLREQLSIEGFAVSETYSWEAHGWGFDATVDERRLVVIVNFADEYYVTIRPFGTFSEVFRRRAFRAAIDRLYASILAHAQRLDGLESLEEIA